MGSTLIMAFRAGYGYPVPAVPGYAAAQFYGSARLSNELKQEEDFLTTRRQLYSDLRQSEAAEELLQDQRTAEIRTAEATEQARRAATAEQIYARALEEYRLRDAECKAAMAAAADAKALYERANDAARKAEEVRNAEVAAAEKKAQEAREAEAALNQAAATEQNTAATLSRLEADAASRLGPIYQSGYRYAY